MRILTSALALTLLLITACGAPEQEAQTEEVTSEGVIDLGNATCPVMELEVMDGEYVDWEGYRIHFCCAGCDNTFLADPEKYMSILAEDPSVSVDLSSFMLSEDSTDCMPGGCGMMTAECPDCTDEVMCDSCIADNDTAACHTE